MFAPEVIVPTLAQLDVLKAGERGNRHIHVSGGQRSGKSRFATYSFLHWAGSHFSGHDFALCSKSATAYQAVVGNYVQEFCLEYGLTLQKMDRCWAIEDNVGSVNFFYPILYSGSASGGKGGVGSVGGALQVARAEGPTFAGALIDEACECPVEMLDHLSTRTSVRGAKIFYSYFPQSKLHPLKTKNYDLVESGQISGEIHHLSIEDNPANSTEYVQEQKDLWSALPHEYARRIDGRWSSATGIVYELFEQHLTVGVRDDILADCSEWVVSADWARSSVSAAILVGWHPLHGKFYVPYDWKHDGAQHGIIDTATKVRQMIEVMTGGRWDANSERFVDIKRWIDTWIIDPNEDGLRSELHRQAPSGVVLDAVTGKERGTKIAIEYLQSGNYAICQTTAPNLVQDFARLSWDQNAKVGGVDRPSKQSADGAHFADCWEYYCATHHEAATTRNPFAVRSDDA